MGLEQVVIPSLPNRLVGASAPQSPMRTSGSTCRCVRLRRHLFRPIALLVLAPLALAHPIKTSIAEANYHRPSQKLAVALRVFVDDFEAAVSAHALRPISLAKTSPAEFEACAHAYVAATFTVRTREGTPAAPHWVRREVKETTNELWFHFEVPLPGGVEGARLRHGVLADHFPSQINSVRVHDDGRKATLVFLPKQTEKTVRFHP